MMKARLLDQLEDALARMIAALLLASVVPWGFILWHLRWKRNPLLTLEEQSAIRREEEDAGRARRP